jgi:hypothetical protein
MRSLFGFLIAATAIASATPARAQLINQPGGASVASMVGVHGFFIVEREKMQAKNTFDAILADSSKSTLTLAGGGVEITRLWKGLFFRVAATRAKNDGSRVFIADDGTVVPLNVPLTVEIIPLEIGGGWRFTSSRSTHVVPYVGAAVLTQRYRETAQHASADENTDVADTGESIFGGVELAYGFARLGFEGQFRNLPDALGSVVSTNYKETNLGGAVFRVTFGVGF